MNNSEKIKVIIIDDETPARNLIKRFLADFTEFEIIAEAQDGFQAVKLVNELNPDILFLDIKMPKLDGFEVLDLLSNSPIIIFSTAYDEYALKAFEKSAVDYLLKPFSKERFAKSIQKAKEKWQNLQKKLDSPETYSTLKQEFSKPLNRIVLKQNAKIIILPTEKITHFEAQDDYVYIHTENAKYLKYERMKNIEANIDSSNFMRVHRSFIVNLNFIDKIEPYEKESYCIILKNNTLVKVSKSGYKKLKNRLGI